MERKLLLLGLLRAGDSHGYHLMEMLDKHTGTFIELTKPTAYRLLEEMLQDGWLSSHEEKAGRRPARRILSLTPEGEKRFTDMLRDCLSYYKLPEFRQDIALLFLGALPQEDVVDLLVKRLSMMKKIRQTLLKSINGHAASSVLNNQLNHIELDTAYTEGLITTIKKEGVIEHG